MPAVLTQRQRIQTSLISLAKAGEFYVTTYTPETWLPIAITRGVARVYPASALANEIESSFDIDKQMGRVLMTKRSGWTFELLLRFHREVTLEFFEEAMSTPTILAADADHDQVTLFLRRTGVAHPTTQNSPNGTEARLVFHALPGRI